jgi:trans-aconitate methyltransferase
MSDPVHDLYQSHAYPAMSHPLTDPAVTSVCAELAGLEITPPSGATILEIGCASGHNLLPLAARWPDSRFTGIDFSRSAIEEARETSRLAGIGNVEFIEADLRNFEPDEGIRFDHIIAHGFYSWVPEDVRQGLLDFCAANLPPRGVAFISYNTLPGWSLRKSIVELTRQLSQRTDEHGPGQVLAQLAMAAGNHNHYARHLTSVLHDMFGKGDDVLAFDDFGPINEPCSFLEFAGHAARSGLRYLGESQLADNQPDSLAPDALEILGPLATNSLERQQMIDVLTNRTFRRSLLCRADAPIHDRIPATTVLNFSIRCPHVVERGVAGVRLMDHSGNELARFDQPLAVALFTTLTETRTQSIPIHEVIGHLAGGLMGTTDLPELARLILQSARKNLVSLRHGPVSFDTMPPVFPNLGALSLLAARKGWPLVDPYHAPCMLNDVRKQQLAVAMDGTRRVDELVSLAETIAPGFDFTSWLAHLTSRGMFSR